jgi:hypothetical protein
MTDKDKAAGQAELDARKAELDAREAAFAEREREATRKESEAFCEGLVRAGRLPPGLRPSAVAIMGALAGGEVVEFAEAGETVKKPALECFKELLRHLPKSIEFAELAPGALGSPAELAAAGAAGAAQLGERAREYQAAQAKEGRKVDVAQAVHHLTGA